MEENPHRELVPYFGGNHRSLSNDQRCYVRFINLTHHTVEVTWINYGGEYVIYRILQEKKYVDVNTFKTHPWLVREVKHADRLHIDKNWVYYPKTTREYLEEKVPNKQVPDNYETRLRAYITLPVHSLRYLSLLCIRNCIVDKEVTRISELELPRNLASELKKLLEARNRNLSLMERCQRY